MIAVLRFCFILILLGLIPIRAFAKNLEIRSDNFVLRGNVKEKDGEALLRDLEVFRDNLFQLYGKAGTPEIVPVPIYIVKNGKDMKFVTGTANFGGMYTTTLRGPVFVLNAKKGLGRKTKARHTALHEYTHHITASFVIDHFPLWYNEGYANYLATFSYKNDTFKIGDPYDPYAYALSGKNWMPMTVLLASTRDYPFNINDSSKVGQQTVSQFYAQAWLAAHYIHTQDKMKGRLAKYIHRINDGEDAIKAFTAAMGYTPEAFEAELKAYYKRNKYVVTQYASRVKPEDVKLSKRELTKTESARNLVDAKRAFSLNPRKAVGAAAAYEAFEKKHGQSADTLSARADLGSVFAETREDLAAARALAEAALALDPDHNDANRVMGAISVMQFVKSLGGQKSDMPAARLYLHKTLKTHPYDPMANYYLAASFYKDRNISEEGLKSARYALSYYRDRSFIGSNLNLANILVNAGDYEQAAAAIKFARVWGRKPEMRMRAQAMQKYIERRKSEGR